MKPSADNVCYESGAEGGWVKGASVEKTRETSGSWATRHCTPAVLLFCLRGFCSVHESNDHSLPSPTRQFQPARWESASPSLPRISASFPPYSLPCFRYFRVSRHILIKSTYFHGCAFFARFARSTAQRDFHSHRDAYSNSWYYAFREIYVEGMVCIMGDLWRLPSMILRGKGFWEIKCFFVDSVLNYRWGSLKNRELVKIFAFGSDKVFEFYRRWIFCKFEHRRIYIGNYWLMYIL